MDLPSVAPVRQQLSAEAIPDPSAETRSLLRALPLSARIHPGMNVAVGVGSRGISCIREVVHAVLDEMRACGAQPFLVPAMGSHGGGTAEGQRAVLEGYGLGEDQTGVPIRSDMTVEEVGRTADGMPVYFNSVAAQADAIIVVNRIKPHTGFRNRWESGLLKILAVGLGKEQGAATIHAWNVRDAMPAAARVIIESLPVVAGVAIVENGFHRPVRIAAIPAEAIEETEPALLELAWQHLPRIPLEPLDLLVLGEIGKDISGTGMDLNVVGMWRRTGGPVEPAYRALVALDLTENSHGNAVGVGYCDVIPQRLRDKIDISATYTNCLTAANYNGAKLPITLPSDRDVILAGLPARDPASARMVIARNTLDLDLLWVSAALLQDVAACPLLEQVGALQPLEFTGAGALVLDWNGTSIVDEV
jgi:hypothetical protein